MLIVIRLGLTGISLQVHSSTILLQSLAQPLKYAFHHASWQELHENHQLNF